LGVLGVMPPKTKLKKEKGNLDKFQKRITSMNAGRGQSSEEEGALICRWDIKKEHNALKRLS